MIVARPNCSCSWNTNLLVLTALAVPSLGCAIGFAFLGAWPILPFAGLEMFALGCSLYYVNWKQQYRHVITVSEDVVRIDKGFYAPRRSWKFRRPATGLAITEQEHPGDGPHLAVHDDIERVDVGGFLNRHDREKLVSLLRSEMPVGTYSQQSITRF